MASCWEHGSLRERMFYLGMVAGVSALVVMIVVVFLVVQAIVWTKREVSYFIQREVRKELNKRK